MEHGLPEGVARKLGPLARYELRATLFGVAVVLVGVPFGMLLHQVATNGPLTGLDDSAARWLNRQVRDHDLLIAALNLISFLGKPIFLLVVIGLPGLWILRHGGRKLALFLGVTCVGGGIVDTLVKLAVGRPRPEVDQPIIEAFNYSFPSGHAMQAVVCYGALALVVLPLFDQAGRRWIVGGTIALALAIGMSRLALGVHYISDVLGGYVLGAAWLAGSVAVFELWREDRGRRPTHPLEEGVEPEEAVELATTTP